jgi:hypothetical protein
MHLLGGAHVPSLPFSGSSTLVSEGEEFKGILDVICGELIQHLLITHPLSKCDNDNNRSDAGDGVPYLEKSLDESMQHLSGALLHDVEVNLYSKPRVGALKVRHVPLTELGP